MNLSKMVHRMRELVSSRDRTAVFVHGCQRSGTGLVLKLLSRAPECSVYGENDDRAMRDGWRLRDPETIRRLIATDVRRVVVFKPLNDSQHADRHLEYHPRARSIWMFRRHTDVANSALKKWGDTQRRFYRTIHRNEDLPEEEREPVVYRERMSPATLSLVRRLAGAGMTPEDGAVAHWYVRNRLFFDLGLDRNPRCLLVKYEDLVGEPRRHARRLFEFAGVDFRESYVTEVFESSVGKRAPPEVAPALARACAELARDMDSAYRTQLATAAGTADG